MARRARRCERSRKHRAAVARPAQRLNEAERSDAPRSPIASVKCRNPLAVHPSRSVDLRFSPGTHLALEAWHEEDDHRVVAIVAAALWRADVGRCARGSAPASERTRTRSVWEDRRTTREVERRIANDEGRRAARGARADLDLGRHRDARAERSPATRIDWCWRASRKRARRSPGRRSIEIAGIMARAAFCIASTVIQASQIVSDLATGVSMIGAISVLYSDRRDGRDFAY
mgnify:CR=1 FL=1